MVFVLFVRFFFTILKYIHNRHNPFSFFFFSDLIAMTHDMNHTFHVNGFTEINPRQRHRSKNHLNEKKKKKPNKVHCINDKLKQQQFKQSER